MFYTVFVTNNSAAAQWQAELLEFSWRRVGQEGVLIRLHASDEASAPRHALAHCIGVPSAQTPVATDGTLGEPDIPTALLEWSWRERPEGTVLVIDADTVFRRTVDRRVAPMRPIAQPCQRSNLRKPSIRNPFGFPPGFEFLGNHCARVDLAGESICSPILLHSTDLRRIVARWVELNRLIQAQCRNASGQPILGASSYAYIAASAEFQLQHEFLALQVGTCDSDKRGSSAAIISYREPLIAVDGREVFSKERHDPSHYVTDGVIGTGHGWELAKIVNEFANHQRHATAKLAFWQRVKWGDGVKEGRVGDDIFLEIPTTGHSLWLNLCGKVVWELCDGSRTIEDIRNEIGRRYSGTNATADILRVVDQLSAFGFLKAY